jgi:hypothetical protein
MPGQPFVDLSSPILQAYFEGKRLRDERDRVIANQQLAQQELQQRQQMMQNQLKMHQDTLKSQRDQWESAHALEKAQQDFMQSHLNAQAKLGVQKALAAGEITPQSYTANAPGAPSQINTNVPGPEPDNPVIGPPQLTPMSGSIGAGIQTPSIPGDLQSAIASRIKGVPIDIGGGQSVDPSDYLDVIPKQQMAAKMAQDKLQELRDAFERRAQMGENVAQTNYQRGVDTTGMNVEGRLKALELKNGMGQTPVSQSPQLSPLEQQFAAGQIDMPTFTKLYKGKDSPKAAVERLAGLGYTGVSPDDIKLFNGFQQAKQLMGKVQQLYALAKQKNIEDTMAAQAHRLPLVGNLFSTNYSILRKSIESDIGDLQKTAGMTTGRGAYGASLLKELKEAIPSDADFISGPDKVLDQTNKFIGTYNTRVANALQKYPSNAQRSAINSAWKFFVRPVEQ